MKNKSEQAVLITGTSSGIGYSSVLILAQEGFKVFAGVRNQRDAEKLAQINKNVFPVIIDVTLKDTINSAFDYIKSNLNGECFSLVNNAGIAVACPIEIISMNKIEYQFEVNVLGQIRLIQHFLPLIRKTKGKIINISSIFGSLPLPFTSAYCSSKAALDCLSTGLRLELKKWGIQVVTIKPGIVKTPIWQKSSEEATKNFTSHNQEACIHYKDEFIPLTYLTAKFGKLGSNPEDIAKLILKILLTRKTKPVYLAGIDSIIINFIRKFPQFIVDKIIQLLISTGLKIKS